MQQMMRSLSPNRMTRNRSNKTDSSLFAESVNTQRNILEDGDESLENASPSLSQILEQREKLRKPTSSGVEKKVVGIPRALTPMSSVVKSSQNWKRPNSFSRKRSDSRKLGEIPSIKSSHSSKSSFEEVTPLSPVKSNDSMTAKDSFVLDTPLFKTIHTEKGGFLDYGDVDNSASMDVSKSSNVIENKFRDDSSEMKAPSNEEEPKKSSLPKSRRNVSASRTTGYKSEAECFNESADKHGQPKPIDDAKLRRETLPDAIRLDQKRPRERSFLRKALSRPFSPRKERQSSETLPGTKSAEGNTIEGGVMLQSKQQTSSKSPHRSRADIILGRNDDVHRNGELPDKFFVKNEESQRGIERYPTDLDEEERLVGIPRSSTVGGKGAESLIKRGTKGELDKNAHRQRVIQDLRDFKKSVQERLAAQEALRSAKQQSTNKYSLDLERAVHGVSSKRKVESEQRTSSISKDSSSGGNAKQILYLRLTPHYLSGVTTERVRWKSSHTNMLVHGLVAHVQEDGSIESPASFALSQPITPILDSARTSSYCLVWSNPTVSNGTRGRVYMSVPVEKETSEGAKVAPDQEIIVGIKRGQEMIQLGYAYVPVFNRSVSGLDVEIEIVPFDNKKKGIFSKRNNTFENDDKVYGLGPVAILRATLDIKRGQKCNLSETNDQTGPEDHTESLHQDEERIMSDALSQEESDAEGKSATEETSSAGESTDDTRQVEQTDETPYLWTNLGVSQMFSGIMSWRSDDGDEESTLSATSPTRSDIKNIESRDWYTPKAKMNVTKTEFDSQANTEKDGESSTLSKGATEVQRVPSKKVVFVEASKDDAIQGDKIDSNSNSASKTIEERSKIPSELSAKSRDVSNLKTHSKIMDMSLEIPQNSAAMNDDDLTIPTLTKNVSADHISLNSGLGDVGTLVQYIGMCTGGPAPVYSGPSRLMPSRGRSDGMTGSVKTESPSMWLLKQGLKSKHLHDENSEELSNSRTALASNNDVVSSGLLGSDNLKRASSHSAVSSVAEFLDERSSKDQVTVQSGRFASDRDSKEYGDVLDDNQRRNVNSEPHNDDLDIDLVKLAMELEAVRNRAHNVEEEKWSRLNDELQKKSTESGENIKNKSTGKLERQSDAASIQSRMDQTTSSTTCGEIKESVETESEAVESKNKYSSHNHTDASSDASKLPHKYSGGEQEPLLLLTSFTNDSSKHSHNREHTILLHPSRRLTQTSNRTRARPRPEDILGSRKKIPGALPQLVSMAGDETVDSIITDLEDQSLVPDLQDPDTDDLIAERGSYESALVNKHGWDLDCLGYTVDSVFASMFGKQDRKALCDSKDNREVHHHLDDDDDAFQEYKRETKTRRSHIDRHVSPSTKSLPFEEGFEMILHGQGDSDSKSSSSTRKGKRRFLRRGKQKTRAPLGNKRLERLRSEENFGLGPPPMSDSLALSRIRTPNAGNLSNDPLGRLRTRQRKQRLSLDTIKQTIGEDSSANSHECSESDHSKTNRRNQSREKKYTSARLRHIAQKSQTNFACNKGDNQSEDTGSGDYESATKKLMQLSRKLGVPPEKLLQQIESSKEVGS